MDLDARVSSRRDIDLLTYSQREWGGSAPPHCTPSTSAAKGRLRATKVRQWLRHENHSGFREKVWVKDS